MGSHLPCSPDLIHDKVVPELVEYLAKDLKVDIPVIAAGGIAHPFEEDLSFLYGTIFTGVPLSEGADSRNVCIFAEGEVDRSPTGTGVSARAAIHRARGELGVGEEMVIEAALTGDARLVYQALCYDPLTAAVLSLAEIKKMVAEMLRKNRDHLPQFKSVSV